MRHRRKPAGDRTEPRCGVSAEAGSYNAARSTRWLQRSSKSNGVPAPGLEPGLTQLQRLVRCQLRYAGLPPRRVMELRRARFHDTGRQPVAVSAGDPSSYLSSAGFGSAAQDAPMLDAAHPSIWR